MATLNLGRIKPVFRGAYSGSTAYVVDDIVTSGGSSYICIQAHGAGTQAVNQTAYWTQMAAGGTDVGTTLTTQGDILYRDGSGLQRLAKGTANQILQINSGATAPEWVAKPQGIAEADMWRMTSNSGTTAQDPVTPLERVDDATFAKIGTGMTESSGIFTFPETGLWWIRYSWDGDSGNVGGHQKIHASTDSGSSYDELTSPHTGDGQGWYVSASTEAFVNVTNASTFRVKFEKVGAWNMYGNTSVNRTMMTFIRLGDSQ